METTGSRFSSTSKGRHSVTVRFESRAVSNSTDGRIGDSFGRKSVDKEFRPHLLKWLNQEFPGGFTQLGDTLPHHSQLDFVHCGIYTANTLEHALFATPLIRLSEVRPLRMTWFFKFVHQSSAHPASPTFQQSYVYQFQSQVSLPLFVNHNFPQLGPEDFFEAEIPDAAATLSESHTPPLPPSSYIHPLLG